MATAPLIIEPSGKSINVIDATGRTNAATLLSGNNCIGHITE
jgi:hypothetical protein